MLSTKPSAHRVVCLLVLYAICAILMCAFSIEIGILIRWHFNPCLRIPYAVFRFSDLVNELFMDCPGCFFGKCM